MTNARPNPAARVVLAVVVVSGVLLTALAAFGVPAFIDYMKGAKVAEAASNLDALRGAVRRYCEQTGGYPPPAGPIPKAPRGGSQSPDFRADPTFRLVGFDPGGPVYYSYAIEAADAGIDVVAYGDLDGDGERSERRIHCGAGCACGAPTAVNELE